MIQHYNFLYTNNSTIVSGHTTTITTEMNTSTQSTQWVDTIKSSITRLCELNPWPLCFEDKDDFNKNNNWFFLNAQIYYSRIINWINI